MIISGLQCAFVRRQTPEFPPSCLVCLPYRDSFSRLLPFRLLRELKHQGWYPCWPLLNGRKVSRWQGAVGRHSPPSAFHPGRLRAGDKQDQGLEGILLIPRESMFGPHQIVLHVFPLFRAISHTGDRKETWPVKYGKTPGRWGETKISVTSYVAVNCINFIPVFSIPHIPLLHFCKDTILATYFPWKWHYQQSCALCWIE